MNKFIALFTMIFVFGWSADAWSFNCKVVGGSYGRDIYVNLTPQISAGQNLVLNLSNQIYCHNDYPDSHTDYVSLTSGSAYGGALANFRGTLIYSGSSYAFPLAGETKRIIYKSLNDQPWPVTLYLTPLSTAAGVAIKKGDLIARLALHMVNNFNETVNIVWNLYANNSVVVPTGGCDVSARNITVTLPDYPGTKPVPLNVYCSQNQKLAYYLTGNTSDSANSIFTNTALASPAQGIGVQLIRNGSIVPANSNVSLGWVGRSPVNIGLTATYARTSGEFTPGNVQSIIGVTFVYQ